MMSFKGFGLLLCLSIVCLGLENAKVLPKGVRRVNIKALQVDLTEKFNSAGEVEKLAQPLEKDITFKNVLAGKTGLDNTKLRAFLQENAIPHDQVLGSLSADLKGRMRVIAPVVAYGLTNRITVALAAPYYLARTEVSAGYKANDGNAQNFINLLSDPKYNQVKSAREAYDSFSDGVALLNYKLEKNNFSQLSAWEDRAFGDLTLAVKTVVFGDAESSLRLANLSGVVAPTGRVDDPDILTDVAFGDGTWDVFTGIMCDQQLTSALFLNQFAKFTYQMEASRVMRLKTEDEAIAVSKEDIRYKLGNKLDFGASVQWEGESGLELGLGYEFNKKFRDSYYAPTEVQAALDKDTATQANNMELKLGYSTIPAFKRKEFPVPLNVSFQYKRVIDNALLAKNRNVASTQLLTLDLNLYF